MKKKHGLILALIIAPLSVEAATVNAANLAPTVAGSRILIDSSGSTLTGGFVAIGYFSTFSTTLDFEGAAGSELQSDFNVLGSSVSSFTDTSFGPSINGIFSVSGSGPTVTGGVGDDFIGKQAFLVLGNGATLASSTEAFIFATGVNIPADPSTPITIDFSSDPVTTDGVASLGTIVLGSGNGVGNVFLGTDDLGQVDNALQTATLVPEPSVVLLSGFGAICLLRRKRS